MRTRSHLAAYGYFPLHRDESRCMMLPLRYTYVPTPLRRSLLYHKYVTRTPFERQSGPPTAAFSPAVLRYRRRAPTSTTLSPTWKPCTARSHVTCRDEFEGPCLASATKTRDPQYHARHAMVSLHALNADPDPEVAAGPVSCKFGAPVYVSYAPPTALNANRLQPTLPPSSKAGRNVCSGGEHRVSVSTAISVSH